MIGNSLNKIFDSEQAELREYFTEMAMKELDGDGSGTVDVSEIKSKCLSVGQMNPENGETMDLITFLLLNSWKLWITGEIHKSWLVDLYRNNFYS